MAKPSVENKHLRKRGFVVIIATCVHFILLTKYLHMDGSELKDIKRMKLLLLSVHVVFQNLNLEKSRSNLADHAREFYRVLSCTYNTIVFSSFKQSHRKTNDLAGF